MKVDFWMDIYPGQTQFYPAQSMPCAVLSTGWKRVKFIVDIPMDKLFPVDADLGEVQTEETEEACNHENP